jgi:hypothetical protein
MFNTGKLRTGFKCHAQKSGTSRETRTREPLDGRRNANCTEEFDLEHPERIDFLNWQKKATSRNHIPKKCTLDQPRGIEPCPLPLVDDIDDVTNLIELNYAEIRAIIRRCSYGRRALFPTERAAHLTTIEIESESSSI